MISAGIEIIMAEISLWLLLCLFKITNKDNEEILGT